MGRTPFVGGNWKLNLDLTGAQQLAAALRNRLGSFRAVDIAVFPSFPYLHPVASKLRGSALAVGGQDVYPQPKGAFTGAVSAPMLASLGCTHTLVGHSERRSIFGDTDAMVLEKTEAVLHAGLVPVFCVGESLGERESGQTNDVLARQLDVLGRLCAEHRRGLASRLVVAYEPVWAIGTGKTATPEQAQQTHAFVRGHLATVLGADFGENIRILYGGSVKPGNAATLCGQPDVDGALVGGASLDAASFAAICHAAAIR
jgi:triosephosphate isomerase (TIM)